MPKKEFQGIRTRFRSVRKPFLFCLTVILATGSGCSTGQWSPSTSASPNEPDNFVLVAGGTFKNTTSTNYYGKGVTLSSFYIGKYEVTQREWIEVMGSNPSKFQGDDLPVEMVSWYDCVEYCNKRSIKEKFRRLSLNRILVLAGHRE
jgi:sulfatase modifying factor 1